MSDKKPTSPLRAIMDVRREELPLALLMFGYFFLVITTFWILKPIKKGLFIEFYDHKKLDFLGWTLNAAQAELLAKELNILVAFFAVLAFTALARRLRRQELTNVFSAFFVATLALYAFTLNAGGAWVAWSFYLYGDLYSTLMVATFFAFLNDSVQPKAAQRIYGLVVLGGVSGGVFGSMVVRAWVDAFSGQAWMLVCIGLAVLIVLVANAAGRLAGMRESRLPSPVEPRSTKERETRQSLASEAAGLVRRSPYLLSIVAMVALYELVSTVADFQFSATVSHYLDKAAIGKHFATVYALTNGVSLLVQVFGTSLIMTRFPHTVALLVSPGALLLASTSFFVFPWLWVGSLLSTADNALSYSINQSAREALYTVTSRDEKYKAKAFIDMFVQRFAKGIAGLISLVFTVWIGGFSGVRWLSLMALALLVAWGVAARYAGRQFTSQLNS
jgi:AAA family ATP:ADP antiporter